ncbi:hypothetical protein NC653_023334 [Populus alba x Populus x berolinensis]|uniref:Uncharacterized protein n=1 Tax=Populus alba x Populus x berolinensis TaxID=444605 RepID=A0AAD6MIC3_9ROSI|nr:hypothetical protein NC653_023334 [Populus alba x Populus x berolinensis]
MCIVSIVMIGKEKKFTFRSSIFFFFFVCVSFLICCSKGESRGGWYTWRQSWCLCVGWPVLSSLCFYFPFAYSPIFLPFHLLCVSFTPCVMCVHFVFVSCSCFCLSSVYPQGYFCFISLCFCSSFVPR